MFQTNGTTKWRLGQGVVTAGDNYLAIYDDVNDVGHTTFKAGGNVGIGTSDPSARLHIGAAGADVADHGVPEDAHRVAHGRGAVDGGTDGV